MPGVTLLSELDYENMEDEFDDEIKRHLREPLHYPKEEDLYGDYSDSEDDLEDHTEEKHHRQEHMEGYRRRTKSNLRENYVDISCVDISYHIDNCPLCSQIYYKHTADSNNTMFIILIIALVIICILFIQRILKN